MGGEGEGLREKLRAIAEEARRRSVLSDEDAELEADVQEQPKAPERVVAAESAPAALSLEAGDLAAHANGCARLRALLADGAWHSALELLDVVGLRFGSRLHEVRHGRDGSPALDVETSPRPLNGRRVWFYRAPRARQATQGALL